MSHISINGEAATSVDPSSIVPPGARPPGNPPNFREAAFKWFGFGFNVIPLIPGTKQTAVKWDDWLANLSPETINDYWTKHPDHELGFIIGDDVIVLDADSLQSLAAQAEIEKACDVTPNLTVKTTKGQHHYFKLAKGTFAKTDSHSTQEHPERIDIKARRSMVILPPSTGKEVLICEAENAEDLTVVGQDFVDAVFRHNGREVPRPFVKSSSQRVLKKASSQTVARLIFLLGHIDPDIGYEDWVHALMAIFYETGGSEEGFEIADSWSDEGNKYEGERNIRTHWSSFKPDLENPVTIATLFRMAKDNGVSWEAVIDATEEQFVACGETEVIYPEQTATQQPVAMANPLDKYSLRGMSAALEKLTVEQIPILGQIALKGQSTVIYAAPNTGKTLLTLSLIIEGITQGRIDASKLYYLNMDDTGKGLLDKVHLAEEYYFHMLSEGHRDFRIGEFLGIVTELVENNQCRDVIIVLDTLKKFVDLMDKTRSSSFSKVIRRFVVKGGTLIALAHTNKNPGRDGKPIYGGTSDIIDDSDCAYTLAPVTSAADSSEKVVEFVNIKRRGNVAQNAAYGYTVESGISYNEILLSVRPVDPMQLAPMKQAEQLKSDAEVIAAVKVCILEGINTKMKLAEAAAAKAGISKRSALMLVEKYAGSDPAVHRWKYSVGERGAKIFEVLEPASPTPKPDTSGT